MKVCVCSRVCCVSMLAWIFIWSCAFSCGVVRESSVWRWCVFCSRLSSGALHSISSSRVSAPGRSVLHTHTPEQKCGQNLCFIHLPLLSEFRKLQPSLANTTETASCFLSLTTMMSGTSSPPSPCLDPSWYAQDSNIQYSPMVAWQGSNLSTALLGPPHPGWRPRHRPERQNLCLLDFSLHL